MRGWRRPIAQQLLIRVQFSTLDEIIARPLLPSSSPHLPPLVSQTRCPLKLVDSRAAARSAVFGANRRLLSASALLNAHAGRLLLTQVCCCMFATVHWL